MSLRTYSLAILGIGLWMGSLITNLIPFFLVHSLIVSTTSVFLVPISAIVLIVLIVYISRGYYGQVPIYRAVPQPATD